MKKLYKSPRVLPAFARKGEKGFTLMEILVALAIIAVVVAVTAAVLGGRATGTRLEAVASSAARTIQAQQQLYVGGLRTAVTTEAGLANRLNTAVAPVTGIDSVTASNDACAGTEAADIGFAFEYSLPVDDDGAEILQEQMRDAITAIFIDIPATENGSYVDMFGTGAGIAAPGGAPGRIPPAAQGVDTANAEFHLCLNDV